MIRTFRRFISSSSSSSAAAASTQFQPNDIQVVENPLKQFAASSDAILPIQATLSIQESLLASIKYGVPGKELDKLRSDVQKKWEAKIATSNQLVAAQCRVSNSITHRVLATFGVMYGYEPTQEGYIKLIMSIHKGVQQASYASPSDVEELKLVSSEITTEILRRGFGKEQTKRLNAMEMRYAAMSISTAFQDSSMLKNGEKLRTNKLQYIQDPIMKHDLLQSELMIPAFDKVASSLPSISLSQSAKKSAIDEHEGFLILHAGTLDFMWDAIVAQNLAAGIQSLSQRVMI